MLVRVTPALSVLAVFLANGVVWPDAKLTRLTGAIGSLSTVEPESLVMALRIALFKPPIGVRGATGAAVGSSTGATFDASEFTFESGD